jgi:MoaA/NifB/PqqE/SkfB family radical SAM enzyme
MERLGVDMGAGDISEEEDEEEYDEDEEFDLESRVVNGGGGERMVLDDDLELAQFIVAPPGGIDLSPLFGAVDAS